MLEELHEPSSVEIFEKSSDVCVKHPVHLSPHHPDVQRIQRLMLAASWSESIREAPKVRLVYTIEDCDHGVLDNLVLQRRDSQWTLPPISFRNEHSP
jgi:hypothetical protein